MRTLKKNKQKMYYSTFLGESPVYDGEYIDSDGNKFPIETGEMELSYKKPVSFNGNIVMSGGESEAVEFGIDKSQYSAILTMNIGELPIDETSLIWHETKPVISSDKKVDRHSADYTVVKVIPSLNSVRYLLKKVVK